MSSSRSSSPSTASYTSNDAKPPETNEKVMGKNPGEIVFFQALHSELKKAIHFFDKAQQEFAIREERIIEGMQIMKRPNSIMMSNDRWACMAKSLYQFYKDLLLLETFAIMTYCSFSKILKKHDKVTGYQTRIAFMAKVVNKANFTNYPALQAMIRRCESLYEEVSRKLKGQSTEDLCEDERLFINMIHRLNGQILDKAEKEEGAPVENQRKLSLSKIKTLTDVRGAKAQNQQTTSLRTLLEENEDERNNAPASPLLSDDGEDESLEGSKRKGVDSTKTLDESNKRVKLC